MAPNRPIPVHPELTGVAVAAPVPGMIADAVLPEFPVTSEKFNWNEFPVEQGMTVPDTKVGRTSGTKRVEFGAIERTDSTDDHGLEDAVPATDATANSDIDPQAVAAELTSQLVTLAREIRVAGLVFASGNYLPGQITTYAADAGWYDPDGDPLEEIEAARDAMIVTPNTLNLGQDGWSALRRHPKMVKAARPASTSGEGRLTIDEIRDLLEIETINIGRAIVNTAKPGQTATLARTWANHAQLCFTERVMKSAKVYTWGSTARLTGKQTRVYFDANAGLEGSNVVRVGERLKELVVAKQAGWLFLNAATAPV